MNTNLITRIGHLLNTATEDRPTNGVAQAARSWWSADLDDQSACELEARLFWDPAFLTAVRRQQVWTQARTALLRIALAAGLALIATGYSGVAVADDSTSSGASTSQEDSDAEPPRSWLEWLLGPMKEGGSHDPETGTE